MNSDKILLLGSSSTPHIWMVKAPYWSGQLQTSGKTRASCFVTTNQSCSSLLLLLSSHYYWSSRLWGLSSFAGFFIKTLKWAPPCWAFVFTFWNKELINSQGEISSWVSTHWATEAGEKIMWSDNAGDIWGSDSGDNIQLDITEYWNLPSPVTRHVCDLLKCGCNVLFCFSED